MPRKRVEPPAAGPLSVPDAVVGGDRVVVLLALRRHLALTLAEAEIPNVAGLSKELRAVEAELAALAPPVPKADLIDDLKQRRTARLAAAEGAQRPAKRVKSGG